MTDLLIFLIIFSLLPVALISTPVGILLWNWIGFMNPHRFAWGPAYHFSFAEVVAGVTVLSFLFSKDRKMMPITSLVIVLILFNIWMNVTTFYALVPEDAVAQWQKVMKIQFFIFISLFCMQSKKHMMQLLWVVVLSVAFFGIKGGLFTILNGGSYLVLGPRGSQIEDNNTLALALIMVLPLLLYLSKQVENKMLKWFLIGSCFLCAFSILGSHSRGALLASSSMIMFLVLKSKRKFLISCILLLFIPVLINFMPSHWMERMQTIQTYEQDASAMGRINAWHFAYNLAKDRPFTGGGFETFRPGLFERYAPNPEAYHDSHSIYFEVLGEHGFVGLLLFLTVLGLTWRTCKQTLIKSRDDPELKWAHDMAAMLQVSLIGYVIGGAFLGVAYFDLFYMLVAFSILSNHYVVQYCKQAKTGEIPIGEPKFREKLA